MDDLDALLDAAVERKTEKLKSVMVPIVVSGKALTLKFTELSSREWARATMASPLRADVPLDEMFGYDVTDACERAAPMSGVLVDGDSEQKLTKAQWEKLFVGLEADDRGSITDAIFGLNEEAKLGRLMAAKKALGAKSVKKRISPAK